MTQDEVIKLAAEAGFKWPDICETTIEQRLGRFANLIAVAEREKCTGTQEFVTLPREVVERALDAFVKLQADDDVGLASWDFAEAGDACFALRAALEQPKNHVPNAGNMVPASWKLVPVEPNCSMVLAGERSLGQHDFLRLDSAYRAMLDAAPKPPALEQSQGEQEPVAKVVLTEQLSLPCLQWLDLDRQFDFKGGELLYTHPQPKREPLTDAKAKALLADLTGRDPARANDYDWGYELQIIRAIEAAHNIK